MSDLARSIHRLVEAAVGRVLTDRNVPREEWATVTSLSPLKVLPASATDPVSVTSLMPVQVGDRVWVVFAGRAGVIVSARPGVATLIPAAMDLNTYTDPGQYYQPLSVNAASGTNYPQALAGYLEVLKATNGMLWQRYSVYGPVSGQPGTVWQRDYYTGTWTPWFQLSTHELFPYGPSQRARGFQLSDGDIQPTFILGRARPWGDAESTMYLAESASAPELAFTLAGSGLTTSTYRFYHNGQLRITSGGVNRNQPFATWTTYVALHPAAANTTYKLPITFPSGLFTSAPVVLLTANSTNPTQRYLSHLDITTSGFDLQYNSTSASNFSASVLAVQQDP